MRWIRYWDLATSIKSTADYSCSAAVALGDDGVVYIRDMVRGKWEWPDCRRVMMQTMLAEPEVEHGVESAMNGLAAFQELQREPMLANITFRSIRVDRDKVSRALPLAARAESGKVKLVRGAWIRDAIEELVFFPRGQHDDQVDCISGALQMISSQGWLNAPWVAVSGGEIVRERREGEACEECGSLWGTFHILQFALIAINERILTVIIREGISYRNAHRVVVGGQHQTLAFLNFKTMQLEIRKGSAKAARQNWRRKSANMLKLAKAAREQTQRSPTKLL